MPAFRLNHSCSNPACAGEAGDVIDVTDEVAQYLLVRKGGTLVETSRPRSDRATEQENSNGNSGEAGEPKRKSKTKTAD